MTGTYFVLGASDPAMALFFPVPNPSLRDRWLAGKRFSAPPATPLKVVRRGTEGRILAYHPTVPLMSNALAEVVLAAGVTSLELYDALIVAEDGTSLRDDCKVFNVTATVAAAQLRASPSADVGLLFRVAEFPTMLVVHANVVKAIEARNFERLTFDPLETALKP
ncbi:MAG: hypothetical protein JNM17_24420 [Archangium sp.]|nr:hypothetical protein [Archangium sp.]